MLTTVTSAGKDTITDEITRYEHTLKEAVTHTHTPQQEKPKQMLNTMEMEGN